MQNWTIDQMFETAEDFFLSIGLYEMTDDFWDESVIDQEKWGKAMVCHASAEDFCLGPNNTDFRIKMCTQINMNDLITVHHEMGHIEYFMAYTNLSHVFRTSANPGNPAVLINYENFMIIRTFLRISRSNRRCDSVVCVYSKSFRKRSTSKSFERNHEGRN